MSYQAKTHVVICNKSNGDTLGTIYATNREVKDITPEVEQWAKDQGHSFESIEFFRVMDLVSGI